MSNINNLDELFDESVIDSSTSQQTQKKASPKDGLYRPDLKLVKPENKKRGYKSVIRFLPNYTVNPEYIKAYLGDKYNNQKITVGNSQISRRTYYAKIENPKELAGYYDSVSNKDPFTKEWFGAKCEIYDLKKALKESKNAIMLRNNALLSYTNKTFSYVLILEDEQQPELVGKIMIFSYGTQIGDKIQAERDGLYGDKCNPFSLEKGKDFVLIVTEKEMDLDGKRVTMPEYITSSFKGDVSSVSLPTKDNLMRRVPSENGVFSSEVRQKVVDFCLKRECDLEYFAPKRLTPIQEAKLEQVKNYMLGKPLDMSKVNPNSMEFVNNIPTSNDFEQDLASTITDFKPDVELDLSPDQVASSTDSSLIDDDEFWKD